MKVTMILPLWSTHPASMRGLRYAKFLTERGHRVNVILPAGDPIQFTEIEDYTCTFSSFLALPYIMKRTLPINFPMLLQQRVGPFLIEDDLIHSFKPALSGIPSLLSKYLKKQKLLLDLEDFESAYKCQAGGFIGNYIVKFLERMLPKHVDGIIVPSRALKKWIISMRGMNDNVFYLPIGTEVLNFRNTKEEVIHEIRRKYHIESCKVIVHVGGIRKVHDIDIVLYAMKEISKEIPTARLLIVGRGSYLEYLKKLVHTLNFSKHVIFTGYVPYKQIPNFLSVADIVTLPMRNNLINQMRFPTKLCEYLASGKPIVTNAVGELKYIIQNGKNGFLANPGCWRSFARKIIMALSDESLSRKVGNNARELAWKYDVSVLGERLEEIYRGITNG